MRIFHGLEELELGSRRVCLAIGFFDGVHLGHQQIIRQTITDARQHNALAVAVTFDRHPATVLAPERVPPLIYALPQKIRTIESLGVDALLLLHFDAAFSRQTGGEFIHSLHQRLGGIHSICVGANFLFGHARSGNVELLKGLGEELGFTVHAMAAVSLDGELVSSTRIRKLIQAGDLDGAGQMLGRAYSIEGSVIRGAQIGRTLGFPTANIDCAELALPPMGVYAVCVTADGRRWPAVLNIGTRPTLKSAGPKVHVEAHLLDFEGELYGERLEITFVQRLRAEQQFKSLEELKEQIGKDVSEARKLL